MKKILLILLITISSYIYSFEKLIGSTPGQLVESFGSPDFVFVERGKSTPEDDVVFFYNSRLYVYFNQNRAWQVRLDEKFKDKVIDIKIGDDIESIISVLGAPKDTIQNSIIYHRPDRGYPVFMRLYFKNEKLDDIYFYRGDY